MTDLQGRDLEIGLIRAGGIAQSYVKIIEALHGAR